MKWDLLQTRLRLMRKSWKEPKSESTFRKEQESRSGAESLWETRQAEARVFYTRNKNPGASFENTKWDKV